ncbi:polysaccharide biosynthesis protein [Bowmanella dokdonensis]|uniref:Polysaccharide biosynthesis protein n=2 Tax=Bowmanella dokdonensis TaxID=751969 RepID=A0A939IQY5_9ALTE|nr:polysaccharide biosynthesis protein [Bowmanella dokdonensis]
MLLSRLFNLSSSAKLGFAVVWDSACLVTAFAGSYWIRLGIETQTLGQQEIYLALTVLLFHFFALVFVGFYHHVVRHLSLRSILIALAINFVAALYLFIAKWPLAAFVPDSIPLIYLVLSSTGILGPRVLILMSAQSQSFKLREKCLIFGAGQTGRALAQSLTQDSDLLPVAFIDDINEHQGKTILGLTVYGPAMLEKLIAFYRVNKILLAVNDRNASQRRDLLKLLEPYAIELLSVPDMKDLLYGQSKINQLREIRIEELLGREPVPPVTELISEDIRGKNVLVTGAGGSIGSELCRQIAAQSPRSLTLLEACEFNLYQVEAELSRQFPHLELISALTDIRDEQRIYHLIRQQHIHTLYHAAAYKHVPMVEKNILAGISNNVLGTANLVKVASLCQVGKFVLVSTDKAVRPTNVMGASKRLAELCVQAMQDIPGRTRFAIVRFGNVLGSSGSVVPLFSRQIKAGGPLTITHPEVVRYFMTIPEAAQLVIQAGTLGEKGEVFVLDMGEPVRILDLAHKMAHLMGYSLKDEQHPEGDIEVRYTGLRPGEKLYEELLISGSCRQTRHPRIMSEDEARLDKSDFDILLEGLRRAVENQDEQLALKVLLEAPLCYQPERSHEQTQRDHRLTGTDNFASVWHPLQNLS